MVELYTDSWRGYSDKGENLLPHLIFPINFCLYSDQASSLTPGVKQPGREATTDVHLMPSLRMRGAIPPLPQYVFIALHLVKHWDNFSFTLSV